MKDFVNKHWIAFVGFMIVLAMGLTHYLHKADQSLKDYKKEVVHVDSGGVVDKSTLWRDSTQRIHSTSPKTSIAKDLAAALASRDSVLKVLQLKDKQLEGYSKAFSEWEIQGKFKLDTVPQANDSSTLKTQKKPQRIYLSWNDQWTELKGAIGDTNYFHVYGTDTMFKVDYWKRDRYLGIGIGAKRYYADFYHTNMDVEMAGSTNIIALKDPNHYNVSISAGIGYSLDAVQVRRPSIIVGITVGRTLFKF